MSIFKRKIDENSKEDLEELDDLEEELYSADTKKKVKKKRVRTIRDLAFCGMFSALIAVGAFIKIPMYPVPITLQTFFVGLAGILLGSKYGAMSVGIYIVLGLSGLPIFTQGGGPSYVFIPTFGYIIGFLFGAFLSGFIVEKAKKKNFFVFLLAQVAGLVVIYFVGVVYFYCIRNFYIKTDTTLWFVILNCFIVFILGDVACSALGAVIGERLRKILPHVFHSGLSNLD
ncbi:MAG: biotin transporter BioY [Christensenellaceae bacterium]|jgi:biotin transport system substrate-specific component|nr:biotin transporter BioY [Christensenellaceae bacterium]